MSRSKRLRDRELYFDGVQLLAALPSVLSNVINRQQRPFARDMTGAWQVTPLHYPPAPWGGRLFFSLHHHSSLFILRCSSRWSWAVPNSERLHSFWASSGAQTLFSSALCQSSCISHGWSTSTLLQTSPGLTSVELQACSSVWEHKLWSMINNKKQFRIAHVTREKPVSLCIFSQRSTSWWTSALP